MLEQPSWLKLNGPQSLLADLLDSHDPFFGSRPPTLVIANHLKSPLAHAHKIFSVLMPKIQHNYRR